VKDLSVAYEQIARRAAELDGPDGDTADVVLLSEHLAQGCVRGASLAELVEERVLSHEAVPVDPVAGPVTLGQAGAVALDQAVGASQEQGSPTTGLDDIDEGPQLYPGDRGAGHFEAGVHVPPRRHARGSGPGKVRRMRVPREQSGPECEHIVRR
jgi:hypothetical protein